MGSTSANLEENRIDGAGARASQFRGITMSIPVVAQWLFNAIVANSLTVIEVSALNNEIFHGALAYLIFAGFWSAADRNPAHMS